MATRRVKQNVWGNWRGYEGTRCTFEFGTDDVAAGYWVITGKHDYNEGYSSPEFMALCLQVAQRGRA